MTAASWWQVVTLPRADGIVFSLRLWTDSTDPEVVEKIERAAKASGMSLIRIEEPVDARS